MEVQPFSPEMIQDTSRSTTPLPQQPTPIPASEIDATFSSSTIDLLSSRLPTLLLHTTDEFFAPASSLNLPHAPIHKPNTYTPNGAWYDGWETRRHNPSPPDTVTFRLGVPAGRIKGVEADTGFFSGNHAELVGVEATFLDTRDSEADDRAVQDTGFKGWEVLMQPQRCSGATRHAWLLPKPSTTKPYTHVRISMYPDGGLARLRLHGTVVPVFASPSKPESPPPTIDLAALTSGGLAVSASDEHFGRKANLLLPGRGIDMGDGWETGRSRGRKAGEGDWVIVRLGAVAEALERVVVDTAFFKGNFPQSVAVSVAVEEEEAGEAEGKEEDRVKRHPPHERFVRILDATALGPHKEHEFVAGKELQVEKVGGGKGVRWVKMEIFPDGGVKRLRVFGKRRV